MILYISVKLFRVGSQKFTRLLILPICAKKTKAKRCQIELLFACVMALSDAVTALWECHVSEHCYGTMLCVCVKQSLRLLSSQFPPCLPAQSQPRFGFGACRGQPAPNLCSDTEIAVATLLSHGAGVHTELSCRLLSLLWLSLQFSSWKCLIQVVVWGKKSKARFLGLALQMLW